jgi:serine/threonine protein kinase
MTTATSVCPRCRNAIAAGTKFCANCGNDITGVFGGSNPAMLGTIAVEADPNVDVLGQLLSEASLGEYDVYGELGRGGMAAVYLALDLALNRKVAIKTMLPELVSREGMVERFKREAQTAAALSHPHIIQIFTVRQSKSLVYFVMKFIEGRSLESVITDKGQIPVPMAHTILTQVGAALDYAHRKKVIHRDIKPANIMIDEDGWAIVTDFGIAKVQEAQNLTATGTAIGTPHYMSPEQFHNKAVTGLSDQYSLGVVAYEMLAGKKPFDGQTYAEVITQHLFEPPPDLRQVRPDLPQHVVDAVNRMMAKKPEDRWPDLDSAMHAWNTQTTKQEGDVVRTQMISLAKSGPAKKVRMSVPMSPIPQGKRPAPPAATIAEPQPAVKPVARPKAAKAAKPPKEEAATEGGSKKWLWAAMLLLVVGGGGGAVWKLKPELLGLAPAGGAVVTPQGDVAARTGDNTAPAAEPVAAAIDSTAIRDSIRRSDSLRLAIARSDSIRIARAESIRIANAERERLRRLAAANQPRPEPVVERQAAPVATGTGSIRIASGTPNAALYINNRIDAIIGSPRVVNIPAGVPVRLSIRAQGCQDWDSTVTVPANTTTTIGRKFARC